MEIHNPGNNLKIHYTPKPAPQTDAVDRKADGAVEPKTHVSAQQVLDRLNSDDRLRQQLLVEVKAKVLAGEYLTRAAAEEAAQQIVGD